LSGLLSRVGQWNAEHRVYLGARQTRFALHPASALAKKPPAWVMAFELVETTQLFARTAAKIDPLWLSQVGGHLLKRSYSDPHWSEKSARASVREHATLFGLTVLRDHSVDYATLSPVRARLMFLEHALVRGEYQSRGTFQGHNKQLLDEVARLRDKARQSDMLADEERLLEFFDRRVPAEVVNGKTFEAWRERAEKREPALLWLAATDVASSEQPLRAEDYPDSLEFQGVSLPASYRFDPSADDDGVTLDIPLALLPQLSQAALDGTIPAWREQKITALLGELPRALRREVGSIPELVSKLAERLASPSGSWLGALGRAISELTGVSLPEDALRPDAIPAYLSFNFRVLGDGGKVMAESRDLAALLDQHGARARDAVRRAAPPAQWERSEVTAWDFGDLPPFVTRAVLGTELRSFPALVDCQKSVAIRLFEAEAAADSAHRDGVRRLLRLGVKNALLPLAKRCPPPFKRRPGLPVPRAEADAFRELVLDRVVSEAFGLATAAELPRSKAAFDALVATGVPRLAPVFELTKRAIDATDVELEKTLRALDAASKHPSGTSVVADIRAQLAELFPADLLLHVEVQRLEHFPRYLRAAQARLARAVNEPRKDAGKAAPFTPLWQSFLAKRASARDPAAARRLHFVLEELRVALFAPELKPAQPVTLSSVALAIQALR